MNINDCQRGVSARLPIALDLLQGGAFVIFDKGVKTEHLTQYLLYLYYNIFLDLGQILTH